jgi:hypothetical protein
MERTPNAIRSPLCHAGSGDSHARLCRLHDEFSVILQLSKVFVRHQGAEHFITGHSYDTLNFSFTSVSSGEPRYNWRDRGDGILYGYLRSND